MSSRLLVTSPGTTSASTTAAGRSLASCGGSTSTGSSAPLGLLERLLRPLVVLIMVPLIALVVVALLSPIVVSGSALLEVPGAVSSTTTPAATTPTTVSTPLVEELSVDLGWGVLGCWLLNLLLRLLVLLLVLLRLGVLLRLLVVLLRLLVVLLRLGVRLVGSTSSESEGGSAKRLIERVRDGDMHRGGSVVSNAGLGSEELRVVDEGDLWAGKPVDLLQGNRGEVRDLAVVHQLVTPLHLLVGNTLGLSGGLSGLPVLPELASKSRIKVGGGSSPDQQVKSVGN